ncbi:unnamed protein product [Adineta ricciae]|uniref:MATH domain-containing protein n=1 Tax=Adineta ricciae TaxID=249248 RepID=A0A815P1P6_ADIRI|nr:unnamed protein product [Adineta ricciae]
MTLKISRVLYVRKSIRPDRGFRKDMDILQVVCGLCDWTGQLQFYQIHLEQCHKQYACSFCSSIFDSQLLLNEHEENACLKRPVYCCLKEFGCKEQMLRGELKIHYQTEEHNRSLTACVRRIREMQSSADVDMKMETSSSAFGTSAKASSTTELNENDNTTEEIFKVLDLFSTNARTVREELQRLAREEVQMSRAVEEIEKTYLSIKTPTEDSKSMLSAIQTNLTVLREDLLMLNTRFEEQQVTSNDGILIWRITEVSTKFNDARSERQTSIYSPPFRSSPSGYLMRARLYLFGDGNARRTHISLFFVLLRGQHDSILSYPFNPKVTFCLYDQTPAKSHIVESFRPDPKSNSFQRPRSDMNIASGIPRFAPLK